MINHAPPMRTDQANTLDISSYQHNTWQLKRKDGLLERMTLERNQVPGLSNMAKQIDQKVYRSNK